MLTIKNNSNPTDPGAGASITGYLLVSSLFRSTHVFFAVLLCVLALGISPVYAKQASKPVAAIMHPDFTGLWKVADPELTVKPPELAFYLQDKDAAILTDEAKRRFNAYTSNYNTQIESPELFCMAHGMPWIMVPRAREYLIDIYQTPDRVTMLFEGYDIHRLIHLDQTAVPDNVLPSTNGYSLGHWEGSTLVIETSALRPTNEVGPKQRSDQMLVTERWRLIQHPIYGRALEVDLTVVDPVIYSKAAHGYQLFAPGPPGGVLNAYGCNESMWDDHVTELDTEQRTKK